MEQTAADFTDGVSQTSDPTCCCGYHYETMKPTVDSRVTKFAGGLPLLRNHLADGNIVAEWTCKTNLKRRV